MQEWVHPITGSYHHTYIASGLPPDETMGFQGCVLPSGIDYMIGDLYKLYLTLQLSMTLQHLVRRGETCDFKST
jgi:hypothetical protein